MPTIRLTAAQAMVRWLAAQMNEDRRAFHRRMLGDLRPWQRGGPGRGALHGVRDALPTYRGHNEQTMAHAAIAYAKQLRRTRAMMVTSSIGPGATNMVTAAALAHVNRLPVLLVPGDVFATAGPTRCCSRSRISATARSAPMTASGPSAATSTGSPGPNIC
jgi:3D-(3,5/4)-trihydroxycyclohexane-1,2-dione acylhydrolase (decyclizing)